MCRCARLLRSWLKRSPDARSHRLPPPPRAERRPVASTRHGVTLTDDYAWLRADNWREVMRDPSVLDPAIRAYLEAENVYEKLALAHTAPLQDRLFAEMKGRIKEDDSSVPSPDGAHAYYYRYREGGQHPIACRQPREGGAEETLLDGDALAAGKAYFQLGATRHSPDHRLFAWSADDKGSEYDTLRIRELARDATLPTSSPTSKAHRCGPRIHRPSITCGSTPIIALRASIAIGWAAGRRRHAGL